MNRNVLLTAGLALVSMVAGALLYESLKPETALASKPNQAIELHSIPLTDLSGREALLSEQQGKVLIVNFWAPWCEPCRREIPSLLEIHDQYANHDVEILGIAFDRASQVDQFVREYEINYPIFLAGNRSAMYNSVFDNPSGSLPYTALLDRDLRIIFQHNGEMTAAQLREQIEQVL